MVIAAGTAYETSSLLVVNERIREDQIREQHRQRRKAGREQPGVRRRARGIAALRRAYCPNWAPARPPRVPEKTRYLGQDVLWNQTVPASE